MATRRQPTQKRIVSVTWGIGTGGHKRTITRVFQLCCSNSVFRITEKTRKYLEKSATPLSAPKNNHAMKSDRFSLTTADAQS